MDDKNGDGYHQDFFKRYFLSLEFYIIKIVSIVKALKKLN